MAVTFTEEQLKAITLHDRNILVSAAAGSGKTAVLVERIIRMITRKEDPVDIDRILVVTFTSAAAAEMRERISLAIERALLEDPENEHLQKQSTLLHNAKITTIDSFCLFVVKNNFNDIGLDPAFRIADEGELKLMKQDVLTELLEEWYQEGTQEFHACVEYFTGGSSDRALEEYIGKLYDFAISYPWPEEWLKEREEDYKITDVSELESQRWMAYLLNYVLIYIKESADRLREAVRLAEQPSGPYYYGEMLEREVEMLEAVAGKDSYLALSEAFSAIHFDRLPGKKDDSVDPLLRDQAKEIRNAVKKQIDDLQENFFLLPAETVVRRMQEAAEPVRTLLTLTIQFLHRFEEKKRQENVIDFSDMEHMALQILIQRQEDGSLVSTAAAREYRQFFTEILNDEYQDSNRVQELLLKSISGEEEENFNRFMVGDVKQSIYKFRLARPELFIEKYTCYSNDDSVRQRIDLHQNFRSRKEVITSINHVFEKIMDEKIGGISYDDAAALYPGAVYPEGEDYGTEILLTEKDQKGGLSGGESEAVMIASRIRELHRTLQVQDKESGGLRPVKYSDMVILLRAVSSTAEEFRGILEKEGIPAYVTSRTGYFQAAEVREILALLQVLNNPMQDIPLFGTMKSFFGRFSEEEIAEIRAAGERNSLLYEDLTRSEKEENGAGTAGERSSAQEEKRASECGGGSKVSGFLQRIRRWRKMAVYTPIHKLIQSILTETGYLEYIQAKPGGDQRRANVEMLLVRAAAFENTSYYGLFHFLRYMKQLEKYQVDYGEADVLDENADVVRIMSIHKSKGLEFPVCFVAGLSHRFNRADMSGSLILDVDMGIGVDYVQSSERVSSRTLRKNVIATKLKLEALSEEMRILYVAMTRAREKLIMTAMVPDLEKVRTAMEQREPYEKVPFSMLASAGSFLDFLLPCLKADEVTFRSSEELFTKEVEETIRNYDRKQELLLSEVDNELMTEMSQKLNRTYPHTELQHLFVKTTVSELKKAGMGHLSEKSISDLSGETVSGTEEGFTRELFPQPEVTPYIPSFIKEKETMSGTDRGTAYHKVMELLDFAGLLQGAEERKAGEVPGTGANQGLGEVPDAWEEQEQGNHPGTEDGQKRRKELDVQLQALCESGKLKQTERDAVADRKIEAFLNTDLARRMARAQQAGKLYREQPFVLGLPANRLEKDLPEEETVLIQGIIDVFFEEEDTIIVADYKTDRVETAEELVCRYQVQLDYYAQALERLTGKTVKEKLIYSFALSREIPLK